MPGQASTQNANQSFDEFQFSEMMSAKFCHDLAGPIGALNNGLEFMTEEEDPEMKRRAVELLKLSAGEALVRLQAYRVAYGVINQEGENSIEELRELIAGYFKYGNVAFSWRDESEGTRATTISNSLKQLIVNLVFIAAGSLVYGGSVEVAIRKLPGGKHFRITGKGDKIKEDPQLEKILNGQCNMDELSTRNVQVFFVARLVRNLGVSLSFRSNNELIELEADYRKI